MIYNPAPRQGATIEDATARNKDFAIKLYPATQPETLAH